MGNMSNPFRWDPAKNSWLRETRGFGFEDVIEAIEDGRLLADLPHSGTGRGHQRLMVVAIDGYAIVVPYVEDSDGPFLKTAFPDRRATRRFMGKD